MRACGECQVCCTVAEIAEVASPAGSSCAHQCSTGCSIFGQPDRPSVCTSFGCAWYRGVGSDDQRPDKVGLMCSVNRTARGHIGLAIEIEPGALFGSGRDTALAFVRTTNVPLVVSKHGSVPPNDTGDWLVLKREHVLMALSMRGPLVEHVTDDVSIYQFAPRRAS